MDEVIWEGPMELGEQRLVLCRVRRVQMDDCIVERRDGPAGVPNQWTWVATGDELASKVYMTAMLEFRDILPREKP